MMLDMLDVRRGQTRAGFYCQTSVSTDDEVRPCALCVLCACMHCVYAQRCRLPSCAQILQACMLLVIARLSLLPPLLNQLRVCSQNALCFGNLCSVLLLRVVAAS